MGGVELAVFDVVGVLVQGLALLLHVLGLRPGHLGTSPVGASSSSSVTAAAATSSLAEAWETGSSGTISLPRISVASSS